MVVFLFPFSIVGGDEVVILEGCFSFSFSGCWW